MRGGLQAWQEAGYPTVAVQPDQQTTGSAVATPLSSLSHPAQQAEKQVAPSLHPHTFLSGLVGSYLSQPGPPVRKELTVLFVDIADSTAVVLHQPPEVALALVQSFMAVVTEIALAYCGDVKDYEGDGALLYFESVSEATRAALAIRAALRHTSPERPQPLHARLSLNVGDVIIGVIGTALRRSVAVIGPSINLAARLLKQIPPGGIIATAAVVEQLWREAPTLATHFQLWNERLELKGFHDEVVTAFHIPSPPA